MPPPANSNTTVPGREVLAPPRDAPPARTLALMIAWSASQHERTGEIAFLHRDRTSYIGRNSIDDSDIRFAQQRPGEQIDTGHLAGESISRRQISIVRVAHGIAIENLGKHTALHVNGVATQSAILREGDTFELYGHYLFLVTERPVFLSPLAYFPGPLHTFGLPDRFGIVGESRAAWAMREELAITGMSTPHVLLWAPSGAGKELAARAIHALSARAHRILLARNAASFSPGIMESEMFGNCKGYPNPGTPERTGLVPAAEGGTLLLDEIAELPHDLQAFFLRFMDAGGQYHRLGDPNVRHADVRIIGATNRDPKALKHDFAARLTLQVLLPSLDARRDDIPLLVRHLVLAAAKENPQTVARFVAENDERPEIRIEPGALTALLRRSYPTNVRELNQAIWRAIKASHGMTIVATDEMLAAARTTTPPPDDDADVDALVANIRPPTAHDDDANDHGPSRAALKAALDRNGGKETPAGRELNLTRSGVRYWVQKYGLRSK